MYTRVFQPLKRKAPEIQESSHPVVVIGDSEPEGDDGEVLKREERTSVTSVVTSSRTLANTGGREEVGNLFNLSKNGS